jgi:lysozyme
MKTSATGLRLLETFEGLRLDAYPDPGTGGEPWTIGVGTTRYPGGRAVREGDRITEAQAREFLALDVEHVEQAVERMVTVPLTQPQFDALVSLGYNIGIGALGRSTLIRRLNESDADGAAAQFDVWINAGGKPMEGLRRRRRAERALFETTVPAAPIENRIAPQPAQAPAEPADDPTPIQPVAVPVVARQERPMAPILAALLPSLVSLIPEIGKLFGDGPKTERNTKVAEKVAEIVVAATGAPNLQGAVEQMERDPTAVHAARQAVQSAWYEIVPADGGGIDGARTAAMNATAGQDWRAIGYGVTLALLAVLIVGGGGAMVWSLIRDPLTSGEQRGMLIGAIVAIIGSVVAFFFGSSVSSRAKDSALVNELGKRQP